DAGIPDLHEVEERSHVYDRRRMLGDQIEEKHLAELIAQQDDGRDSDARSGQSAAGHAAATTASLQRRQSLSWECSTSGRTCQQRSHFTPPAGCGTTATFFTSSMRKASAGPSPSRRVMPDVMQISAKSISASAARSSADA